ncbi:hypothetical protein [Burkholderia reimsis]|uniref:hypothetical protein n=1 Tax=Burkholderia reimsis TaxID=2234132 RepID=UPI001402E515|nr:hypothetical protein [Burkholderia reimsis]
MFKAHGARLAGFDEIVGHGGTRLPVVWQDFIRLGRKCRDRIVSIGCVRRRV